MRKTIKFDLTAKSIDSAIKQIESFEADFLRRVKMLRDRVAEEIAQNAQISFDASDVERSYIAGEPASNVSRKADVSVSVSPGLENVTVVVASGEDAVWVEFGTGVHYNGPAGSSPNPWGAENGLTIGSYGQKNGQYDVWRYYENGELYSTHGVPATMPMYSAAMDMINRIDSIAREVFG